MSELDYVRVEKAIRWLEEHAPAQPGLREVAGAVGMSEYHFQRLFRRWAGVSPKRFLQHLTAERARGLLRESGSVLEAAYGAGLSSAGRLHDLMVSVDAVTPGEVRRRGEGVVIEHGFHATPFGACLLAATPRGICALRFLDEGAEDAALRELGDEWPAAELRESGGRTAQLVERVFGGGGPIPLHLRGTNFQLKVWEALLRIPSGAVATYEQLAAGIGAPRAARAVGSAVGQNPVAYLIPCHRVIRKTGAFGEYRWGAARKRVMLGWEAVRAGGEGVALAAGGD